MDRSDYRLGRAGPVSTMLLGMTNNAIGAGMGTSGLVGPMAAYATMGGTTDSAVLMAEIIGLYFIAPAAIAPCYRHGHEACRLDQARRHEDRVSPLFGRMPRAFR